MRYLAAMFMIFLTNAIIGQTIDQEIGFKFVKAEYLFGTERYEDAIKELNEIIKSNPNYKNALLLRANTKNKLAAYKGAKEDALKYIELNGITQEVASILGKADYALNNTDAALNSITAAISLGSTDSKLFEQRAQIYQERGQMIKACQDWEAAARLGSTTAGINAKKLCGSTIPKVEVPTPKPQTDTNDNTVPETPTTSNGGQAENNTPPTTTTTTETPRIETTGGGEQSNTETVPVITQPEIAIPEEDDTKKTIVIDEDLTLEIYGQGLGKRSILETPSILILSDENGTVTIEICVGSDGTVEFAEYNAAKSTLRKNSLVSLAIRKAKDFWFEKSEFEKQCGFIEFKVKGS